MASVSSIRDGLKTAIDTIAGLRVHDTIPQSINPPAAVVFPEAIDFDSTMARGSDDFVFRVVLLASRTANTQGQDELDGYLAGSGSGSIKAAIESDSTLGGVADFARVARAENYGIREVGQYQYFGVDFIVEVTA